MRDRKKNFRCDPQKAVWVFRVIFGVVEVRVISISEFWIAVITTEQFCHTLLAVFLSYAFL